jgi:hypothetical protein
MTLLKVPRILILLAVFLAMTDLAHARKSQLHVRTGILNGKFNGLFTGKFELNGAVDVDYEMFLSNDTSFLFRFIQGFDSPDSRPFYTYAGTGARRYIWGKGTSMDQSDATLQITSHPTMRVYIGGDLGISQVIVKSFGPTVQAVANMVDLGFNVGGIYQLTESFGVELHGGLAFGYGMSSTHANGHTERLMIGATYFF